MKANDNPVLMTQAKEVLFFLDGCLCVDNEHDGHLAHMHRLTDEELPLLAHLIEVEQLARLLPIPIPQAEYAEYPHDRPVDVDDIPF